MKFTATVLMLDPNYCGEKLDDRVDMADDYDFASDEWDVVAKAAADAGKSTAKYVIDAAVASAMLVAAIRKILSGGEKGGAT